MPLERTEDGGYTLTDPDTGRVRHFAPPRGRSETAHARIGADHRPQRQPASPSSTTTSGAPLRIVHSGGYQLKLTVEDGRVTAALAGSPDGADQLMRYGYTDGNLTEVTNSSGLPLRFAYDDERRVISWTDTNDRRYDYVYDNQDRVHRRRRHRRPHAGPHRLRRRRRAHRPQGHDTDHRRGAPTRHLVDDRCQIVAVTDPLGHTARTRRDRLQPAAEPARTPLGRSTTFAYDEAGRLHRRHPPRRPHRRASRATTSACPSRSPEPDGAVWRQEYDERGNRTAATDPAGHTTRYAYDAAAISPSVTDALGAHDPRALRRGRASRRDHRPPGRRHDDYERDAFGRPVDSRRPARAPSPAWSGRWRASSPAAPDPDGARGALDVRRRGQLHHATSDAGGGVTTLRVHPLRPARGPDRPGRRALHLRPRHRTAPDAGHQPPGPDLGLHLRPGGPPGLRDGLRRPHA